MTAIDDGEAFEQVLAESESRLVVIRASRHRLRVARRAQAGGGVLALLAVSSALLASDRSGSERGIWIVASLLVAAACLASVLVVQATVILRVRRQAAVEERVMLSDVNRLRELFIHIARREEWDRERTHAARQRLSRFPIEGEMCR
ncbi:hypothetical protein [Streptomyces galbus]|uniref:DUF4231 domain-containing protein n=1 Tax=Streptomyces galbus TaxID=33898 RepID=A0A4U5X3S1_STRGB|nr:hypothetical protein [Streptomyces galbus]TKT07996.1 hypothetical protein E4U92_18415 [Streptomyces galbus]GHD42174.1 hypothetical protein GCM10010335_44740 [Streptomyces galbus]